MVAWAALVVAVTALLVALATLLVAIPPGLVAWRQWCSDREVRKALQNMYPKG